MGNKIKTKRNSVDQSDELGENAKEEKNTSSGIKENENLSSKDLSKGNYFIYPI